MKFGIDIGHNCPPDTGATGIRFEDDLTMQVGQKVIAKLKQLGNVTIGCTPKFASSVLNSLYMRCATANSNNVDLYVSIHFNSGGGSGTEVYAISSKGYEVAENILNNIVKLGYINRGVKDGSWLYVLKNTKAVAVLVECAFVDSVQDMNGFDADKMANAIVTGITGIDINSSGGGGSTPSVDP